MYDKERLSIIISDLERFLKDLDNFSFKQEDLQDRRNFYACSMIVLATLNRLIDLGNEVILSKKLGIPTTYKDVFRLLWLNKIINKDLEKSLRVLMDYRNTLSHEYQDFTPEKLYSLLREIETCKKFIKAVKNIVGKSVT